MRDSDDLPTELAPSTREATAPTVAAGGSERPPSGGAGAGLAGAVLAERYEIVDFLGRGGMGEVYRARDRELDEIVALKVLRPELAARAEVVERFRNEVKLARRVTHRAVARTFELGTAGGVRFLTMEFVDGEPLARVLARHRTLEPAWCVRIAAEVCDALAAAHEVGIVHRDIKPDNVLLTRDGRVVVTDFGVARLASDGTHDLSGTPAYMAPEQVSARPPSPATDLYALGVTLYEALTGLLPFEATSPVASLAMRIGRPPPDPRAIRGDVPPPLAEVVTTAMAEDPARRYGSASAMRAALLASVAPRSLPPTGLGIEARAPEPRPWTTVEVRPPVGPSADVHHLTAALVDEMTLLLGSIPHLRVSTGDEGAADLIVRCELAAGAGRVVCAATWSATGDTPWAGQAPLTAGRLPSTAEIFTRSIALAIDVPDPTPAHVVWPSGPVLDRALRGRRLFHVPVYREIDHSLLLLAGAVRREAALAWGEGGAEDADPPLDAVAAVVTDADVDAVLSAPLLAMFAMASLRAAFFATDHAAPVALAARAAQRARELSPRRPEVHLAIGHLALHRGEPVAAARSFREAIHVAPAWPEAHEWLGRMLLEAGFVEDGERRAHTAIRLDPRLRTLAWEISRAHGLEGEWDRANAELGRLASASGGLRGRWLGRLRSSAWRAGAEGVRATYAAMRRAPAEEAFEPLLCDAFVESVTDRAFARWAPLVRARVLGPGEGSARRRAVALQVAAEAAFASGCEDDGMEFLERAAAAGLFDLHWLDRCPLLAPARGEPGYPALRAAVAGRAHAIVDALFGE